MTSRASLPTNRSYTMVPLVRAGAKPVSCSEMVCQDSPFLEFRMHCPCVGEFLGIQYAFVRSVRPTQVCLRVSELGVDPTQSAGAALDLVMLVILWFGSCS